jgi:hypothetical protein
MSNGYGLKFQALLGNTSLGAADIEVGVLDAVTAGIIDLTVTGSLKFPVSAVVDSILTCTALDGSTKWRSSANLTSVTCSAFKFTGGNVYDILMNSGSGVSSWVSSISLQSLDIITRLIIEPGAVADKVWTCKYATGEGEWRVPAVPVLTLAGDVTGASNLNTVALVGGSTASNVHSAELLANAATNLNTVSTIVKRDASGNFSAGVVTGNVTGNVTGSAGSFTGSLVGDVTGSQGATVISTINGVSASLTATTSTSQGLTNKTITGITNNVDANSIRNGSTWVTALGGLAPATNQVLSYNGTNAVWSTPVSVSSVTMGGNVTGTSSACTVVGAAGNFAVVGRTTTSGETNSLGLNFTTSNTKMLALTDLGTTTDLTSQNYDGFGSDVNIIRYQSKNISTNHGFYAATSSTASNLLMRVSGNGVVYIPKILNMNNQVLNKMIVLYENGTSTDSNALNFMGFGSSSNQFNYNVGTTSDNHVFYAATSSTTRNELMRIAGSGIVTIPGSLKFETYGGTPTGLNYYEEYTHTTTWSLGAPTSISTTILITRTGRIVNYNLLTPATLTVPGSGSIWQANTAIPYRFVPNQGINVTMRVTQNGDDYAGYFYAGHTGQQYFSPFPGSTGWTGVIAFWPFSATWSI